MKQYLELLKNVLENGVRQSNRTGIDTLTIPGEMLKFDLRDGFAATTTKQLAFKQMKGELIGFLKGLTSAADFRALGCTIWDQNANENQQWLASRHRTGPDDLGKIYSHQWRNFNGDSGIQNGIDQIAMMLALVRNNPENRRILGNAWNPSQLHQAALPPCHLLFQLLPHVNDKVLHMTVYMRSVDTFLGLPFNIASYALLLELFAAWTGYKAGTLTMFLADVHIYANHLDQVHEQLSREPLESPVLALDLPENCETMSLDELLTALIPESIQLLNYRSHQAIKATMAI